MAAPMESNNEDLKLDGELFEYYQQISDLELLSISGDVEEKMVKSMEAMVDCYSPEELGRAADLLDFNLPENRCAYLLMYSTGHSYIVFDAMKKLSEDNCEYLHSLIKSVSIKSASTKSDSTKSDSTESDSTESDSTKSAFNIMSLGGGPGCDLFGLIDFLVQKSFFESSSSIKVRVVDKYKDWKSTFRNVMDKFKSYIQDPDLTTQDLLILPLPTELEELLRYTNFLCIVKYVSAVYADETRARASFKRVFSLLRPGTIILIIDNSGGNYIDFIQGVAKSEGLQPIQRELYYTVRVDYARGTGLDSIRYGRRPKVNYPISMIIYKKTGQVSTTTSVNDLPSARPDDEECQEPTLISSGRPLEHASTSQSLSPQEGGEKMKLGDHFQETQEELQCSTLIQELDSCELE